MTHARTYHVTAFRNGCTTQLQSFEYFRANPYNALLTQNTDPELCKPIIPSSPKRWHSVKAGCYVDKEPLLGLEPISTRVGKTQSALPSRNKRTRFTSEEDALLVDLKENKGWRWKQIEQEFPQRTLNSLQVHYCTKLKGTVLIDWSDSG